MERFDPDKTNPYFHPDATRPPVSKQGPVVDQKTYRMLERAQKEIAQVKREMEEALRGLYQEPVKVLDFERMYDRENEVYRVQYEKGSENEKTRGEILIERKDGGSLDVLPS